MYGTLINFFTQNIYFHNNFSQPNYLSLQFNTFISRERIPPPPPSTSSPSFPSLLYLSSLKAVSFFHSFFFPVIKTNKYFSYCSAKGSAVAAPTVLPVYEKLHHNIGLLWYYKLKPQPPVSQHSAVICTNYGQSKDRKRH